MIGDNNKLAIVHLIKEKGPLSRVEIAQQLGISQPAVSNNVNALLKSGLIEEVGTDESQMGRKPVLLKFNSTFGFVLGVNIGEYIIQCAIADMEGKLIDFIEVPTIPEKSGEKILNQLITIIKQVLDRNNIAAEKVLAAGIGSPGIKSPNTKGNVLAPFIDAWDQIDLEGELSMVFPFSIIIENDVDMDIIGERWKGAGQKYEDMLYLKLGDGVAARFTINGELYRGKNLAAGEIGFMVIGKEYLQDSFHSQGALEQLICNDAIVKRYKEVWQGEYGKPIDCDDINIVQILKMWDEGENIAQIVMKEMQLYIAMVLINIIALLNPEAIILGGQLSKASDKFIESINDILSRNVPFVPDVLLAQLGEKAGIIGAVAVALEESDKILPMFWR